MAETDPTGKNEQGPDLPHVIGGGSSEILDGKTIWHNPEGIGHAFIKVRKQLYEEWLCSAIDRKLSLEDREIERQEIIDATNWFTTNLDYLYDITRPNRPSAEDRAKRAAEIWRNGNFTERRFKF